MSASSECESQPAAGPQHRPHPLTDRWILWSVISALGLVTVLRLSLQLFERIHADSRVQALASELGTPALAGLAVRVGVTLAIVFSVVFEVMYLLLCAAVDERLLPATMAVTRSPARADGSGAGVGPALLVGAAATIPVHLVALLGDIASPKDSPLLFVWLIVVVVLGTAWALRRLPIVSRGRRTWLVLVSALIVIAALSLLF